MQPIIAAVVVCSAELRSDVSGIRSPGATLEVLKEVAEASTVSLYNAL